MNPKPEKFSIWNLVVFFFSIYALVVLGVETFLSLSPETKLVLHWVDFGVCAIFLGDFFAQMITNPKRWSYFLKWGWIDLLSSIPGVDFLRAGRLVRVFRIFRILRGIRSARVLLHFIFEKKALGTLASLLMMSFVVMVLACIAILNVETATDSNIKTAGDALWWALVTVTTIGYGDRYPVTTEGRIIAACLIVVGSGLFATFTAYIASTFLQPGQKEELEQEHQILVELQKLRSKMEEIEKRVS